MTVRWDSEGLESIPLKLIIVAVVATMSVLPAAQALSGLESRDFVRRAGVQMDRLATLSQVLTVQGPGNVRTVDLDFSSESRLAFEQFMFGDEPRGANESRVMLVLNNGGIIVRLASEPPCTICAEDRGPFVSNQATFSIRMTSVFEDNRTIVLVGMV